MISFLYCKVNSISSRLFKILCLYESSISNIISSEFERITKQFKTLSEEKKDKVNVLIEKIEEDDDVQNVFHNMN